MKLFSLLIIPIFIYLVQTKDENEISFIKEFVNNERKPTFVIFSNLCWKHSKKIMLFRKLNEAGIRATTNFQAISALQDHALLFYVDLDCPKAEEVLNVSKLLRSPYRWLAVHDRSSNKFNISKLWELPILADSDFVLAEKDQNIFTLTELHKPSPNGPTYTNPRGFYNGTLKDTRPHRELFRRRQNVMGHPLTMANVIQDSNTTQYHLPREDRLKLHFDTIAKMSWINVHIAFEMVNATPRYIFSHRWGYKKNGQWSGMINDIKTGRADLGTNCVANTERLSVVVFTDSIAKFQVKFIFRQPPLSYVANIFTLPFSVNVWIALVLSIVGSTFTILLASKWEAVKIGTNPTQLDGSIGDAMLLTMSALSQQGCYKEPKKLSGRIMLWVIFTALMALYAAYSANIVVLLQAPSTSIRTLEQLANSKITLAALEVDYNHFVLKAGKDAVRRKIYKKIEPDKGKPQFYDLNEGVERVRKGLFAIHILTGQLYRRVEETFLETEKCDLVEVDFMNIVHPFVPVYKHSPYLELLRVAFKRIHESGIQMAVDRRLSVRKPRCSNKMSSFSSVSLLNIRPVLMFMLIGIGISVLILILEILHDK
uniref:Ionotropic receptor 75p2 n=1 Tax=Heliconius melpomene rosina TaxID=171916 RepID=A0A140G9H4_HELME|nr:ionotropic receptor 75p2 [Heliconius melpomene rosina]